MECDSREVTCDSRGTIFRVSDCCKRRFIDVWTLVHPFKLISLRSGHTWVAK